MGILSVIKQMLGIGTVSVRLEVVTQLSSSSNFIDGIIHITGKSSQKIKSIEIKLEEESTLGMGDNSKTSYYTLGTWRENNFFVISKDELKSIAFKMPIKIYSPVPMASAGRESQQRSMRVSVEQRSIYRIKAVVDVEGAKLDPQDFVTIHLVD